MTAQTVIASVMTTQPLAVESTLATKAALKIMLERNVHHLPVVEGDRLLGVVSDSDLMLAQIVNHGLCPTVCVGDACSLTPYIVAPDTPLAEVLDTMVQRHIDAALVAENGKPVGIYTALDACRHLARNLRGESL